MKQYTHLNSSSLKYGYAYIIQRDCQKAIITDTINLLLYMKTMISLQVMRTDHLLAPLWHVPWRGCPP